MNHVTSLPGLDPFLAEICEQPDAIVRAAEGLSTQASGMARIQELTRSGGTLVLTGMGSSFEALGALESILNRHGRAALLINTAELLHFGLPLLRDGAAVIAVSQSGLSAEIVRLAEVVADLDCSLIAVSNGVDNALAKAADVVVDIRAGDETGPSTKTFTATLVALAAIDAILSGADVDSVIAEIRELSTTTSALVAAQLNDPAGSGQAFRQWCSGSPNIVFVGRGVGLAAANVGALIMKEAAQIPVIGMGAAEFRHGPFELAGNDLAMVVVAIEESTKTYDASLVADLMAAGSEVLVIGPEALGARDHLATHPVSPLFDVIQASIPLQLLTWAQAAEKHDNPGTFRLGSKVTVKE